MDKGLRQRGWSIHSSDGDQHQQHQQRPRADTDMTCDTLDTQPSMSDAEKLHLLNNAFEDDGDNDNNGGGDVIMPPPRDDTYNDINKNRSMSDSVDDDGEGNDMLAMFGDEDEDEDEGSADADKKEPPTKRRKTGDDEEVAVGGNEFDVLNDDDDDDSDSDDSSSGDDSDDASNNSGDNNSKLSSKATTATQRPHVELTQKQQEQLDNAKNKLSKWAARLFDPNRPRGLIEAPQVIPLNDEFLSAFGKREKEYDEKTGREIEIDQTSLDIIDVSDGDDDDGDEGDKKQKSSKEKKKKMDYSQMDQCKVKISNLSYRTTTATIARTCEAIGPVVDVNLILDDNGQSSGRCYVVFEDHETAVTCVDKMHEKTLEGRTLYISLASSSGRKSLDQSKKQQETRYWDRDISNKCNNCGEVGHVSRNCPNAEKLKPCALCAEVGHEMWSCPMKSVCFNCGLPGHVVRDCNQRRGLPERRICTICYRSGHHRFDCREWPWDAPSRDALCMQCGQRGHLMCNEMRWFFGLKGVSCFNCGEKGHQGIKCQRPDIDVCQKNPEIAQKEIERQGTISLSDQLSNQRSSRESRDSRNRQHDKRPRSMPPPRNGNNNNGYSRR